MGLGRSAPSRIDPGAVGQSVRWTRRRFLEVGGLGAATLAAAACTDRAAHDGTAAKGSSAPEVVAYGPAKRQRLELTRPAGAAGPVPVVVVFHGGYWMAQYGLSLMRPLVPGLVAKGWAVANVEYRSVGDRGGGWPGTFDDAGAALDALAEPATARGLDLARVITLGHSAGGHLAVWAAGRHRLPADAPGADPRVRPIGAVAEAGLLDLVAAADQGLGGGAVAALLGGGPDRVPARYAVASPLALVPVGVPVELVHGPDDGIVPLDQSTRYRDVATAAGDTVTFTQVPGDHFALIDPKAKAWHAALAAATRLLS